MPPTKFAVLGNPVVDALMHVSAAELAKLNLRKGDTNLLAAADMFALSARLEVETFRAGGAGANIAYHLAKLGHPVCFLGPLGDDPAGRHFFSDMLASGLTLSPQHKGLRTVELFVMVTPDGARTMAQPHPNPPSNEQDWLDASLLANADWLLVEGYLARDYPQAAMAACAEARAHGANICLQLPAPAACAEAAASLGALIEGGLNLLLANVHEIEALRPHLSAAASAKLEATPRVITASGEGATFYDDQGNGTTEPSRTIATPADNTGAGDAFAAGFLAAYAPGGSPAVAMRRGHHLGAAVIQQLGARLPDPKAVWLNADAETNVGI
ncbi:MAG: hypothetical protein H6922_05870 [Pseudomonadaceae bacterium]|nr:hypothetical protein [Pseudomonadaceae bacterium]